MLYYREEGKLYKGRRDDEKEIHTGWPLYLVKKAGNSVVLYPITGTPCVS